jgi:DNA-binding NtrC family response regulator
MQDARASDAHGSSECLDAQQAERFAELARRAGNGAEGRMPLRAWLELAEAWHIREALRASGGNRSAAARALGIGRRTLYTKMEKLAIERASGDASQPPARPVAAR